MLKQVEDLVVRVGAVSQDAAWGGFGLVWGGGDADGRGRCGVGAAVVYQEKAERGQGRRVKFPGQREGTDWEGDVAQCRYIAARGGG